METSMSPDIPHLYRTLAHYAPLSSAVLVLVLIVLGKRMEEYDPSTKALSMLTCREGVILFHTFAKKQLDDLGSNKLFPHGCGWTLQPLSK
jgi:hypothetical protein